MTTAFTDQVEPTRGQTALHLACEAGWVEGVQALLHAGGRADLPDRDGRLPEELAVQRGYMLVVRAFEAYEDALAL